MKKIRILCIALIMTFLFSGTVLLFTACGNKVNEEVLYPERNSITAEIGYEYTIPHWLSGGSSFRLDDGTKSTEFIDGKLFLGKTGSFTLRYTMDNESCSLPFYVVDTEKPLFDYLFKSKGLTSDTELNILEGTVRLDDIFIARDNSGKAPVITYKVLRDGAFSVETGENNAIEANDGEYYAVTAYAEDESGNVGVIFVRLRATKNYTDYIEQEMGESEGFYMRSKTGDILLAHTLPTPDLAVGTAVNVTFKLKVVNLYTGYSGRIMLSTIDWERPENGHRIDHSEYEDLLSYDNWQEITISTVVTEGGLDYYGHYTTEGKGVVFLLTYWNEEYRCLQDDEIFMFKDIVITVDEFDITANLATSEALPLWSKGSNLTFFDEVNDAPGGKTAMRIDANIFDSFAKNGITLKDLILDRAISEGYTHLTFKYYTSSPASITAEGNATTDDIYPVGAVNAWTSMTCDLSKIGQLGLGDVFRISIGSSPYGSTSSVYIADMYFFNANDFDLDTNLATSTALPLWSKGLNLTYFDEVNDAPGGKTAMRIDANIFDSFAKNGIALNQATLDRAISEGYTHLTFKYYTSSAASITAEGNATTDDLYPVGAVNAWTSMTCDLSKIGQLGLGDVFRISIGSSPYGNTSSVYIADMYLFNANDFDLDANLATSEALPLWSYGPIITEFVAVSDAPENIEAIKVTSDIFDNFGNSGISLSKTITDRAIANGYTHLAFKYYTASPAVITAEGYNAPDNSYITTISNSWTSVVCDLSRIGDLGIGDVFKIVLGSSPWGSGITYYIADMYFFNANDFDLDTNLATSKALPLWSKGSNLTYFDEVNDALGGKTAMRIDANIFDSFAKNGIALNEATLDRAISEGYTHLTFKYYTSSPASITAEGNATTDDIYPVAAVNSWASITCDLSKIGQLGLGDVFRISIGSSPWGNTSSVYIADMYFFNMAEFDITMNLASEEAMRIWNRGTNVTGFGIVNNAPDGRTAIEYVTPGWSDYFANAVTIYKPIIEKAISEGYTALVFEYYTPDATYANIEGYTVAPVYQTPITQNSWTTVSCDLSRIGDMADVGLGDNFRIAVGDSGTFYISNMYFVE